MWNLNAMPDQTITEPEAESKIINCCYICEHRSHIVAASRCRCKLDKLHRAIFARCSKFEVTTDKEIMALAIKLVKATDKWYA